MGLDIIQIQDAVKWNKTVKSFSNYAIFYLAEYVKAFQIHGDVEPILFYFNNGSTRAINVVMKRDVAKSKNFIGKIEDNTYFDLSTPYGYGGFIVEGNDIDQLNKEYDEYCVNNNIICEFVRFNLFSGFETKYTGDVETRTHNVIRTLNIEPTAMLMDFEHKVRKNLKRANSNNLAIEIHTGEKNIDSFLDVYYSTMSRNEADDSFYFPKEFFYTINSMKNNAAYFYVLFENKVISTELVIYDENNCYSYLGGTLSENFNLRPNEFLKYEIIKWAYNKGLKNFVLGGGYGADDGIFNYKKSLAPNGVVDFYIGKKVFINEIYNQFVHIRKSDNNFNENTMFFPAYRG